LIANTNSTAGSQENDNDLYPEDYRWLGIVYPEDVRQEVALITPLAFYDNNNWCLVPKNMLRGYFPNNGKVAAFAIDLFTSKIGQVCIFQPEQNARLNNPENPHHSHYIVSHELKSASLAQILDWTSKVKETLDIPKLLEQGIQLANCFSHIIYIRYQSYLYGPIKLEGSSELLTPPEYNQSSSTGGKKLLVSVYKIPEDNILTSDEGKSLFSVFDEVSLESPIREEDWSLPQVVMKRVLQASKGMLTSTDNVHLSDNRIRELARLSSQEGPSVLHIEEATLKRAQYIIGHQMERLHNIQTLIEDLPEGHPLLKVAREQEVRLRSVEIAQEAEEQIQDQKNELQQIQDKIQETRATLNNLEEDADTAEKRRDQALTVEREVQQHLAQLREEPLRMLADLHLASSLLPLFGQPEQFTNKSRKQSQVSISTQQDKAIQQQSSLEDVIKWTPNSSKAMASDTLQELTNIFNVQLARQYGVQSKVLLLCAAALLAGCIPSISGFASTSLLRAIAQVIASGRTWSVPVPLTALTPFDLFGKIDPERRMFIPVAGSLADIILQAQQHPQELAIVLLEGIDRAPAMPVTVPLLRQYIEVRQNRRQLTPLNLFHPRAIAPDDPYMELAQFIWPENILLAVTLDDDTTSLPLPGIFDPWLVYIEVQPRKTPSVRPTTPIASLYVPINTWQSWVERIRQEAMNRKDIKRIIEQRMLHEILTVLKVENPNRVISDMWPLEDDNEDRQEAR
jgi:hypothetical protein